MRKLLGIAVLVCLSVAGLAQTPNPNPALNVATNSGQFTLSAKVAPLFSKTGTIAATDLGGTFAVTTNLSVRSDNVVSGSQQGYFGGLQYFLPSSKFLAKTNFDPSTFQFYLLGSGGLIRYGTLQRAGFRTGGGVNFDPTHKSKFTVNLIEAGVMSGSIVNQGGVVPFLTGGVALGW